MKIAIFGYPRSGTTMLKDIIVRHLVEANLMDWSQDLSEPFAPWERRILEEYEREDGEMALRHVPGGPWMPRRTRFKLFQHYAHQDYAIKMLSTDARYLPWVAMRYPFYLVERRNPYDAYLSWLIADWHALWHRNRDDPEPHYVPFEASMERARICCNNIGMYYQHRGSFKDRPLVYYEDMCAMSHEDVLRQCGLYQEGVPAPQTVLVKQIDFERKLTLLKNLDEVTRLYEDTVGTLV